MKSRPLRYLVILLAVMMPFSACLYRADIRQGNDLDNEAISQLKLGMNQRQVQFLLGEPAIVDLYHANTWHYVLYIKSGEDGRVQKRIMRLQFNNDQLTEISGDLNFELDE